MLWGKIPMWFGGVKILHLDGVLGVGLSLCFFFPVLSKTGLSNGIQHEKTFPPSRTKISHACGVISESHVLVSAAQITTMLHLLVLFLLTNLFLLKCRCWSMALKFLLQLQSLSSKLGFLGCVESCLSV